MKRPRGFTLVELIVVMVIIGILAGSIALYFLPAIRSYVSIQHRANLTDLVDGAIRTMTRDIRSAVPNSIRTAGSLCFELVPTSAGGRYRTAPDTGWDSANPGNPTQWVNTLTTTSSFDVVTPLTTAPSVGDYVVINNQNTGNVYALTSDANSSRAVISNVATLPSTLGNYRLTLSSSMQITPGYNNARFVIVPAAQQAVFYVCSGATGVDASGNGSGTLYRFSGYGFNANANACPTPTASTPIVATKVESCTFTYDPSTGNSTVATGYMQLQLKLTENNESVQILVGTPTDNTP